jgi:hypothetical protein
MPITNFYYFLITKIYLCSTDIKPRNPDYSNLNFIGNSDKNVWTHFFVCVCVCVCVCKRACKRDFLNFDLEVNSYTTCTSITFAKFQLLQILSA